jgi:single-strand DNA-binding protein
MNSLKNSVRLMGFVGIEPEINEFQSGKKKAKVVLGTKSFYRNGDNERINDTQWHNVIAWGPQADLIEKYVKKGNEIAVEGKLSHRKYTGKDGQNKYITEIMLNEIVFLGKPSQENE